MRSNSFGRAMGINAMKQDSVAKSAPATIYNLQGRKVTKPGRGLYIINGKKVKKR